ncbi:MAG: hypothetical protein HY368_01745, partial [Candidatus Aenigmarchaeota archaeon]|nr:hypothetical protein [Candidatus Aenigmarchaeota archaeon]
CPGRASTCGNAQCEPGETYVTCPNDCTTKATCGNKICEEGEADVPGGCGPGADPRCVGPPGYAGTCPSDCQRPECPVHPSPVCERGFALPGGTDDKGCRGPATCCGDGACSGGENSFNCKQDCVGGEHDKQQCPDGSFVACRTDPRGQYYCDPCRVSEDRIPQGCRQEVEKETGFVKVVCESTKRTCQEISIPQDAKQSCEEKGGRFEVRKDYNGCEFPDCSFGDARRSPVPGFNPLEQKKECSPESEEQREATKQNCAKLGLNFVISVQGGCQVSKCSSKPQKRGCEPIPNEERQRLEQQCTSQGLNPLKDFDNNGCPMIRCGEPNDFQCRTDLPKDAYEKCGTQGGELVVRRDQGGCITFSQCIVQGDAREAEVDPIGTIPEPTELLAMAFRMEELRIELDKLAKKTEDIANYYASTKSADEGRYRRVSDMFDAANSKVEEIKGKLRQAVDRGDVRENDMLEVKRDVRYIKDVMMKDILYLMLSSSEDVKSIKESRAVRVGNQFEGVPATDDTNCGSDGECFNRGFRLCKQLIFYPEGREGPKIEVRGLEGDTCILHAVLPEGQGPPAGAVPGINPPYDMTCKIKNYALGVSDPDKDVLPFCEGPMAELAKKFGTGEGGRGGPGVPGKCSGDECRDYCGRGPAEAKECLDNLGPYLPPEAKRGLEQLASGRGGGGFGFGGSPSGGRGGEFEGEFREGEFSQQSQGGEFRQPQAGNNPCGDGICDDFERNNPNACQVDCRGGTAGGGAGGAASQQQFQQPAQQVQRAPQVQQQQFQQQGEQCSGCLSNNICDPSECSFCPDCRRVETKPS